MTEAGRSDAKHLRSIDGLRALAVLSVVSYHGIRQYFDQRFGNDAAAPSYGAHGVDLFFVISGLCLTLPAFAKRATRIEWRPFLVRRFVRIAPPYYAAIVLFAALGFTAFGLPATHMFAGTPAFYHEIATELAFLDSAYPDLNPAFWTLAVEMRWYLLCPLLFALYRRSRMMFGLVMLTMYAIYQTPYSIADMGTLPAFMFGIVAADILTNRPRLMRFAWPGALAALAACVTFGAGRLEHGDPLWHLSSFLVVLTGLSTLRGVFSLRPLVGVGIASYSIYLIQGPVLVVACRFAPAIIASLLSIAAGFAFWWAVEAPLLRSRAAMELGLHGWFRATLAILGVGARTPESVN